MLCVTVLFLSTNEKRRQETSPCRRFDNCWTFAYRRKASWSPPSTVMTWPVVLLSRFDTKRK
jgi:hypothetical protein